MQRQYTWMNNIGPTTSQVSHLKSLELKKITLPKLRQERSKMEPKPPPEENRSPVPENQENEQKEHALVDHQSKGSPHCEGEDIKKAKSLEFFKAKVFEFARDSRMSPERILLIERRLPELVIDLHVPDHPPYATVTSLSFI